MKLEPNPVTQHAKIGSIESPPTKKRDGHAPGRRFSSAPHLMTTTPAIISAISSIIIGCAPGRGEMA